MDIPFSIFAAAAFVFLIFFSIPNRPRLLRKRKELNNQLPPSPPSSFPILGHLHLLNQPLHRSLAALSTQYGPLLHLRFGSRPVLLVSSPSLAEECLSKNDVVFANRPRLLFGKHIGYNYSAIASSSYGPHWRNLRRIVTVEILSSFRVQGLSAIRAQEVRSLLGGLFRDSETGKNRAELKSKFCGLTFNIIMGMIADKRYYGENVVDLEEAKRFQRIVEEALALGGASNIGDFLPFLGWIDFGWLEKKMIRLVKERDEFLQGLIDEQLRKKKKNDEVSGQRQGTKRKTFIGFVVFKRNRA